MIMKGGENMASGPIESMVERLLPRITKAFDLSIDQAFNDLVDKVEPVEQGLGRKAVDQFYAAYSPTVYARSFDLDSQFTIEISGYSIEFKPLNSYVAKLTLEGGYHGGEGYISGANSEVWWNFPKVHKPAFRSTPPKDIVEELEQGYISEWGKYLIDRFNYYMGVNLNG